MKKLFSPLLMLITLLGLGLFASSVQAQWTNGQNAVMVIGQPDFNTKTPGSRPKPLQIQLTWLSTLPTASYM